MVLPSSVFDCGDEGGDAPESWEMRGRAKYMVKQEVRITIGPGLRQPECYLGPWLTLEDAGRQAGQLGKAADRERRRCRIR